jgi:hypothetical protein
MHSSCPGIGTFKGADHLAGIRLSGNNQNGDRTWVIDPQELDRRIDIAALQKLIDNVANPKFQAFPIGQRVCPVVVGWSFRIS